MTKMIKNLEIKNFKSIKHLKLDCKKINVFIGEPNTGKSNILESLGFLSFLDNEYSLKNFIRFENMINLYYDMNISNDIYFKFNGDTIQIKSIGNNFEVTCNKEHVATLNPSGGLSSAKRKVTIPPFKFYKFQIMTQFPRTEPNFLYPPHGDNLLTILLTNTEVRKDAYELLNKFGLKLVVKPVEKIIEIQKEIFGLIVSYPYTYFPIQCKESYSI